MADLYEFQKSDDRLNPNAKLSKLTACLKELFARMDNSKVIIFVERRKVAGYLTDILNRYKYCSKQINSFLLAVKTTMIEVCLFFNKLYYLQSVKLTYYSM